MGCLFALLGALSSFTVVLMPRSNLSHGCRAFRVGEENKDAGSHATSYTLCAHLNVYCTCGLNICSHLTPTGGGAKQPYPFLPKLFCVAFVRKRRRLFSPVPIHTAVLHKERRVRGGQRWREG